MDDNIYTMNNREDRVLKLHSGEKLKFNTKICTSNIKSLKIKVLKLKAEDNFNLSLRIINKFNETVGASEVSSRKVDEDGFYNFKINPIIGCYDKILFFELEIKGGEDIEVKVPLNDSDIPCVKIKYEEISRELEKAIISGQEKIDKIYKSNGWKMLLKLYIFRDKLISVARKIKFILKLITKIRPKNVKKAIKYINKNGFKGFINRLISKVNNDEGIDMLYGIWLKENEPTLLELEGQRKHKFNYNPKISILVPTFNTPVTFLHEMIGSVINQTYTNFEICIADASDKGHIARSILKEYEEVDNRIKVKYLNENKGIAENTNECLSLATGEYISLFDHDDLLTPNALFEIVSVINDNEDVEFIYTDEDKIDENSKVRHGAHFKPDYAPYTLLSGNYITHFCTIKKTLLDQVGNFRGKYDGAQDFDMVLRITDKAKKIVHIPKVLYNWRVHSASTASDSSAKLYAYEAGRLAAQDFLESKGIDAEVEIGEYLGNHKINFKIKDEPLVSIVIPTMDHIDDLKRCIDSILKKSSYKNYEIVIVENNSKKEETFEYYDSLKKNNKIKIVVWENEFNFSSISNFGVKNSSGEYIILLNNDTEVITKNWIEEMLGYAQRDDVGIVGAKLLYPDDTVQHGGVIVALGGIAGHIHHSFGSEDPGYYGRLTFAQNFSAVTAACFMVSKAIYEEVSGFDEELKVACNDVDFCLKVRNAGYYVVWNPWAKLYHYESKSRGYEDTEEKKLRYQREGDYIKNKWKEIYEKGDPFYNPNLSLEVANYSLRFKP